MTDPEVAPFLERTQTVIVPTGSTEQHGPHGPLLTDAIIPTEVARRAAPSGSARVVAPPSTTRCRTRTSGSPALVHIRVPTFMALIEDLCASLASIGFRRIVFLNGHYDNTYAIAYACATAAERLPAGDARLPGQLLGRHDRRGGRRVLRPDDGPPRQPRRDVGGHGHRPRPRRPRRRERRAAAVPRGHQQRAGPHGVLLLGAGLGPPRARSPARGAMRASRTAEYGERYLEVVTDATVRVLDDIERTFAAMPPR